MELSGRSLQLLKIFLKETFSSGWDVELLYFLRKNENQFWTSVQLVEYFQIEQSQMERSLLILRDRGLIVENSDQQNYRYLPETSGLSIVLCQGTRQAVPSL